MTRPMRSALITGGSGFIGKALTRRLLAEGIEIRNLDVVPDPQADRSIAYFQGSFFDHAVMREAMAGVDCVFHLAATGFAREANLNPLRDAQENIIGTLGLLDFACEAQVRRVVYCSSGGMVYGPADLALIPETAPTHPITAYGISKLACEKYMRLYDAATGPGPGPGAGALSTVTLRVANPFGAGQNISKAQGALTTFCAHALRGTPLEIWGDGSVERDYIDVRDVAEAFLAAGLRDDIRGTEINIGSGQGTSLNDLIRVISGKLGQPVPVNYKPPRSIDVKRNVLDIAKARDLLGWRPVIGLDQGIADLLSDLRQRLAAKG